MPSTYNIVERVKVKKKVRFIFDGELLFPKIYVPINVNKAYFSMKTELPVIQRFASGIWLKATFSRK